MRSPVGSVLLAAVAVCASARGGTFLVTNANDGGTGSLRWAIEQANATPGPDSIDFESIRPIVPASLLPAITDAVSIPLS